jgi:hypothetical protein
MAKMRSPNYPAMSLRDSVQRTRNLWAKEKRTPVPAEIAAKAIGYAGISGPSRTALASMKKYGLIESDEKTVRVSDLALRILHAANEQDSIAALQEAALKPDLFALLHESHADASDDAISSYLIVKLEFSESGARQVVKSYRDTISLALLDRPEYITAHKHTLENDMQTSVSEGVNTDSRGRSAHLNSEVEGVSARKSGMQTISVPLGEGVFAEVRVGVSELKPEHFRALKLYLEVAEKLLTPPPTTLVKI